MISCSHAKFKRLCSNLKEEVRKQEASSAEQSLKDELKTRTERLNQVEKERKVSVL